MKVITAIGSKHVGTVIIDVYKDMYISTSNNRYQLGLHEPKTKQINTSNQSPTSFSSNSF